MPAISTHINFFKLLENRDFGNYERNYFLLGCIVPDYYISFYDEKMGCISHFKDSIFDKSILSEFIELIGNKKLNYNELSYTKGYYAHLWLDNYFNDYGDYLKIYKPKGMEEKNARQFVKEKIKKYDMESIKDELVVVDYQNCSSNGFINVLPVTIEKVVELLDIFINTNLEKSIDDTLLTVIKQSDYYGFLELAVNTFINEL